MFWNDLNTFKDIFSYEKTRLYYVSTEYGGCSYYDILILTKTCLLNMQCGKVHSYDIKFICSAKI
jgi:hypothetical protein